MDQLKKVSPRRFEEIIVLLLVRMGYGGSFAEAARAVGGSHDGGINGIIKEDPLGLDVIYIQAKRWEGVVGRPEIQNFVGAPESHRAKKGVFITTGTFSREAINYAAQISSRIILIDGPKLAQLMTDYNVGVTPRRLYEIKRIDHDFFEVN